MKIVFAAILMILFVSATGFADIARPDKPKAKNAAVDTTLSIALDKEAKEARLIIPRSQLKQLRAELEAIDAGDDTAASGDLTNVPTIVGGVFLSLAFMFAGFCFFRPGMLKTKGAKAAAVAMVFASGAFVTITLGNAGPPPEARSITGKMFTQAVHIYGFGSGKIKLEVSDEVRNPKLIVPNPPDATRRTEE